MLQHNPSAGTATSASDNSFLALMLVIAVLSTAALVYAALSVGDSASGQEELVAMTFIGYFCGAALFHLAHSFVAVYRALK